MRKRRRCNEEWSWPGPESRRGIDRLQQVILQQVCNDNNDGQDNKAATKMEEMENIQQTARRDSRRRRRTGMMDDAGALSLSRGAISVAGIYLVTGHWSGRFSQALSC